MVIKNKTRKILWARSGNLCAICGKELISSATNLDPEAVIGDECHINARNSGGPRYDSSLSESYIDSYDNLILLCKVHHKIIDDQPNSYPSAGLKIIKRRHEKWVRDNLLSEEESNKSKKKILSRVQTGKDLLNIVIGSHAYDFDYDEPNGEKEINLISEFLQFAQDYGDIGDSIEFGERVNIGVHISDIIKELDDMGFKVFGLRDNRKYKLSGQIFDWEISVIRIYRKDNPNLNST